jgi:DNA-binding PadR family transcriptional regulator
MYADNTLTPKEAIRLCALGTLANAPMRYSALANAVRHFISRITGPSLELMGTSIELLKFEGLVEGVDGVGMEDDALLAVTEKGRDELRTLLTAPLRATSNDLNMLIVTLKFRFLHLLDGKERLQQADLLVETWQSELDRLIDLRQHHAEDEGFLVDWLDHDIEFLESHIAWMRDFRDRLKAAA